MNRPFVSKNNPFNENENMGELFSFSYLTPRYWVTWIFLGLSFFLAYSPKFLRHNLGNFLGWILYKTNISKRNVVDKNLSLTFNKISSSERNSVSKDFFKYLGHMYVNISMLWWKNNESLQKNIDKQGLQNVDQALDNGKSVIILAPHNVSLDFAGRALAQYELLSMYKPFKNNLVNWFIGRSRSKPTDKVIVYPRSKNAMKNIIKKMKKPCVLYLLADEDITRDNSIFTKFFDNEKNTLKSVSKLAKITNSVVLPCVCLYDMKSMRYNFKVLPKIEDFPSNNIDSDCVKINSVLEKQITLGISQYMWTLRIYKNRPDGSDVYKNQL